MESTPNPLEINKREMDAYRRACVLSSQEIASSLLDSLPIGLIKDLVDVSGPKVVREWAAGRSPVRSRRHQSRLRLAYQLTEVVKIADKPWVPPAWFETWNPLLNSSPKALFKDLDTTPDRAAVMRQLAHAAIMLTASELDT